MTSCIFTVLLAFRESEGPTVDGCSNVQQVITANNLFCDTKLNHKLIRNNMTSFFNKYDNFIVWQIAEWLS